MRFPAVVNNDVEAREVAGDLLETIRGIAEDPGFMPQAATFFLYDDKGVTNKVAYALLSDGARRWAVSFDPTKNAKVFHTLRDHVAYVRWAADTRIGRWSKRAIHKFTKGV